MIKNNKGVTLVELLIVIVILGIIAAVSIPAVGNIVDNAQRDAFEAEANNIRSAATTYCAQNSTLDACDENSGDSGATEYIGSDELGLDIDAADYAAWLNEEGDWEVAIADYNGYSYIGTVQNLSIDSDVETSLTTSYGTDATEGTGALLDAGNFAALTDLIVATDTWTFDNGTNAPDVYDPNA